MPDGVPLREALALPALQQVRVLAGAAGLSRPVRYVNVMEVPDILDWVKPDELLLTTAYPLRDDRAALAELVPRLAERGLAGLAVKPARYLDAVPAVMLDAADRLAFPLLELPPETALADIINAVLGLILNAQAVRLERTAAVHERFTRIVLSGGGPREIVHALADLLGRPVAMLDAHGDPLARSPGYTADPPPILSGEPPPAARPDVHTAEPTPASNAQPQPPSETHTPHPTTASNRDPLAPPITAFAIQAGPELLGQALVQADPASLSDDERMAVEQAATVAALRLVQARAVAEADRRFQAVCLDELVTGHLTDRAVLSERAEAFGWDLSRPRVVLLAEIEALDGRRFAELAGTPEEAWACRRLAEAARAAVGRAAIVWERSAGVAVLAPADDPHAANLRHTGLALQAAARQRLPECVMSVGIGRARHDPLELQASYEEAKRSLLIGRQAIGPGEVVAFEHLGLSRLLLSCPASERAAFREASLGPLLAYERGHPHADLRLTLEAFFATNRNLSRTARALYVHYNTVKYRLERLEALLGPFVDDPERSATLELALRPEFRVG
jgi:purine catabolism regulator